MIEKKYSDFIGEEISVQINPYSYPTAYHALKDELWKRVKSSMNMTNGLVCQFENIKTTINNTIVVTGKVIKCEVDC